MKMKASLSIDIELDSTLAEVICADPFPTNKLNEVLGSGEVSFVETSSYVIGQLSDALGKHLAEEAIKSRKQLSEGSTVC